MHVFFLAFVQVSQLVQSSWLPSCSHFLSAQWGEGCYPRERGKKLDCTGHQILGQDSTISLATFTMACVHVSSGEHEPCFSPPLGRDGHPAPN